MSSEDRNGTNIEKQTQEADNSQNGVKIEKSPVSLLLYRVWDNPPLAVSLVVAVQVCLQLVSSAVTNSILISTAICGTSHVTAKLMSTNMFMSGLTTVIQATVGVRLPVFQSPSIYYVVPLLTRAEMPDWTCGTTEDGSQHNKSISSGNMTMKVEEGEEVWRERLMEVSGVLMAVSFCHALIGASGLGGLVARLITPLTITPAVVVIILKVVETLIKFAIIHVGVSVFTLCVLLILTTYLANVLVPIPYWTRKGGWQVTRSRFLRTYAFGMPTFSLTLFFGLFVAMLSSVIDSLADYNIVSRICQIPRPPQHATNRGLLIEGACSLLSGAFGAGMATSTTISVTGSVAITGVLISIGAGWLLCYILTVAGALTENPEEIGYQARTDNKLDTITMAEWFYFPYPGQFGMPTFSLTLFFGLFVAMLSSVIDSLADYNIVSRICQIPRPPQHATNRGLLIEGACSLLSGAFGAGMATSTTISVTGSVAITGVTSRRVFQLAGVMLMSLGVLGKLGAVFVIIPKPVIGAVMIVIMASITGVLLAELSDYDMKRPRNCMTVGLSILLGTMIPKLILQNQAMVDTGSNEVNHMIIAMFGTPLFVAGVIACFLDNTLPGGRGEKPQDEIISESTKQENTVHNLPYVQNFFERSKWTRFCPILPGFGYKPKKDVLVKSDSYA